MNRHLSSEEVTHWVLGERDSQAMRHASTCPKCQAELDSFNTALSIFGKSAREWADEQRSLSARESVPSRRTRVRFLMGAISCAALALTVCLFTSSFGHARRKAVVTDTADADTELLHEVDTEVSQTIPASMEPLTELMSWDQPPAASRSHGKNRHARISKRKSAA